MSLPRIILVLTVAIFASIGVAAFLKKDKKATVPPAPNKVATTPKTKAPIEVELPKEISTPKPVPVVTTTKPIAVASAPQLLPAPTKPPIPKVESITQTAPSLDVDLPHANRVNEFFNKNEPKFPIVETVTYRSRVPWQKGRPAWLSDYASHYSTSRHFIARSLNGKPDYFKQDVAEGDRFNVLSLNKNINFYLVVDATRLKLWLYYIDLDTNQRVLVKDYAVGLGREDSTKTSGSLTPLGKYTLGSKIAVYKPKMTGFHNGQKVEMMSVFGTRWIPFEKEVFGTTAPAKGFGVHGVPWKPNEKGDLIEDRSSLGKNLSDGCIRLATEDMEEIFAIVITKPTIIEIVKDFHTAQLPGIENKK
jgi:L,D-transpeptidase catalytic domain